MVNGQVRQSVSLHATLHTNTTSRLTLQFLIFNDRGADIAVTRMRRHGFHHPVEHVSYEGAGHAIRFPYTPAMLEIFHPITKSALAFGGSLRANAIAQKDSWRKLFQFLGEHLT